MPPPAPETQELLSGGVILFSPTYPSWFGTITIAVAPASGSWTLTGPESFETLTGAGDRLGGAAIQNAPPGEYTLTCDDNVPGLDPPSLLTQTLIGGTTLAFAPTYRFEGGSAEETTITLPGGVPLVLVRIPSGSFQMGSPETERGRSGDEGPVHAVTIAYDFYMGKYEVTQAQWQAVMGSSKAWDYGVGDDYPAYYVSWVDIADPGRFLDKLNQHLEATGQAVGGKPFRLPSEAEWEYACRAGTQTRFYFGDSLSVDDLGADGPAGVLPGNRSDYMWFGGNNSPVGAKPVGRKLPNQFGLHDMHGNVSERCQDWLHDYTGAPTDGSAWVAGGTTRVLRGYDWFGNAQDCRSANRGDNLPGDGDSTHGLRLLRTY